MFWRLSVVLIIGILLEWKFTQSAPAAEVGKTKEKVRAYEFGFSIEEQQHRHEKRDENGIVMGEFGFITADGIYHVTVYATDENGKFKIISMKNYPYGNPEKKIMIAMLPPATKKPVVTTATPTLIKAMKPDGSSCGGCVKPKKMQLLPASVKGSLPKDEKAVFQPLSKALGEGVNGAKSNNGPGKQSINASQKPSSATSGTKPLIQPKGSTSPAQKSNAVGTNSLNNIGSLGNDGPIQIDRRFDGDDDEKVSPKTARTPTGTNNKQPAAPSSNSSGQKSSSTNTNAGGSSATNAANRGGGKVASVNVANGGGPLYRFNYVLDYNSHREEGRTDGSKEGNYKTLNEDGIRRIIDYIANENGYQPHIKLERPPPNELPTGENKLKEYEFVWFN